MATTRKAATKSTAAARKAASTTVKSTAPADLTKPAGTPAEGLDVTPATTEAPARKSRTFDQVVARSASGAMGTGRSRDQKIRLEGHDPQEVARAVAKVRAAKNQ